MEDRAWHRHYDYTVPITLRYPRIPAHSLLDIPANAFPDKAAYNFYGSEMSFWDLRTQTVKMANALIKIGIKKGDRVGIHLPTSPQFLIAYFATLSVGAIIVNLNPMHTAEELKAVIKITELSALFTFDMVLENIRQLCETVEIPEVIVSKITDFINGLGQSTHTDLKLDKKWHHFSTILLLLPIPGNIFLFAWAKE